MFSSARVTKKAPAFEADAVGRAAEVPAPISQKQIPKKALRSIFDETPTFRHGQ
jgi:uncharacterized protein involved in propanediol utilization